MQMKLDKWNIAIGDGAPLVVMAGLNVLEDEALALEVCAELKSICAIWVCRIFSRRVSIKPIAHP